LNQDATASTTLPSVKITGSLSDATTDLVLREHAWWAGGNLRLRELATRSCDLAQLAQVAMLPVRDMASLAPSVLKARSHAWAAAFVSRDVSNALLMDCSELRKLEQHGRLLAETASVVTNLSKLRRKTSSETTVKRFSEALGEWRGLLAPDHFDAMTRQIDRLLSDQEELDEDKIVPSLSSFDDLLAFLSARPWDRAPAVGLNKRGHFSVSWGKPHPHTDVTLTFLGEGSVKWYVFGLGRRRTGSAAGTSDRADLTTVLSPLGCDEWMAR
jgi:hypothetical protein